LALARSFAGELADLVALVRGVEAHPHRGIVVSPRMRLYVRHHAFAYPRAVDHRRSPPGRVRARPHERRIALDPLAFDPGPCPRVGTHCFLLRVDARAIIELQSRVYSRGSIMKRYTTKPATMPQRRVARRCAHAILAIALSSTPL